MGKEGALAELGREIRDSGLVEARSSGMVLVSGGADSACLAAGLVEHCGRPNGPSRCTSTTGCARTPARTSAPAASSARRFGIELRVERPVLAGRQPPGRRPRGALRGRRAAARADRSRLGRDRPHPHRPRRDHDLPARGLARAPRAARAAGAPRAPRAAAARHRPRGHAAARARGRAAVRRRPVEPRPELRAQPDPRRGPAGAARAQPRDGAQHRRDPRRARRGGAAARAAGVRAARRRRRGTRRGAIPAEALAGADPALRRLALRILAERVARSRRADGPAARRREIWRLAQQPEGGEVDLGGGLRAVCELGHDPLHDAGRPRARGRAAPRPGAVPLRSLGACSADVRPGPVQPAGPGARDARRRRARGRARRPHVARRRPDAPARHGGHEDAAGPVHRPQGAALAAAPAARSSRAATASPGWPASRSPRTSGSRPTRARPW